MNTQTIEVNTSVPKIIIGRRNTYGSEEVRFDLSNLISAYGDGSAVLMVKRSTDETAYPAETVRDGNVLVWAVRDVDTSYKGQGECELFWYVGENALAKSIIYPVVVMRDIGETSEEAPEPYQTWVDNLTALGATTLQNAQDAQDAQLAAEAAQAAAVGAQGAAETAQGIAEASAATATSAKESAQASAQSAAISAIQAKDVVIDADEVIRLDGKTFYGSPTVTERVDGGTKILNQLWARNAMVIAGAAYDEDGPRLRIYCVFASAQEKEGYASMRTRILFDTNSPNPPFELTLENAPTKGTIQATDIYKLRTALRVTSNPWTADIRLLRELYDENGNTIRNMYSAQYRYTVTDGVVTRQRVATSPQPAGDIIDFGYYKPGTSSVYKSFDYITALTNGDVYPLVSTLQPAAYEWIVPDEAFEGQPNGLAIVAVGGDGTRYFCSSFQKAEDNSPFIVTCTPTAQDFSGTMDKTVAEIDAAYQAGKQIVFTVMDSTGGFEVPLSSTGFRNDRTYPSFNAALFYDNLSVLIYVYTEATNDGTKNTYSTIVYTLTPAS